MPKVIYTTSATVTGGRGGQGRSDDGALDVKLAVPKQMGGDGAAGTNPEQLFAVGYAACFESALRHVGGAQGKKIDKSSIKATVGIGPRETGGGFGLEVTLDIHLEGISPADAKALVDTVHGSICPYSNAIRGNVPVKINLV